MIQLYMNVCMYIYMCIYIYIYICIYTFRTASQVVLVVKNLPASVGDMRCGFNPWIRKIPWRRKWQPTLAFLPRVPRSEEPGGLQSMGVAKSQTGLKWFKTHTHRHRHTHTHTHFHRFFSLIGYYKILSIVHCVYSRSLYILVLMHCRV